MNKRYKYTSILVLKETAENLHKIKHKLELESVDAVIQKLMSLKSLSQKD